MSGLGIYIRVKFADGIGGRIFQKLQLAGESKRENPMLNYILLKLKRDFEMTG